MFKKNLIYIRINLYVYVIHYQAAGSYLILVFFYFIGIYQAIR